MLEGIRGQTRQKFVRDLLTSGHLHELSVELASWHPADIAALFYELTPAERLALFRLLPEEQVGDVLSEVEPDVAQDLFGTVSPERMADILEDIPTDDAAELLEDLPDLVREELIELMQPGEAAGVRDLLAYPEESAGRIMTQDVVRLRRRWSVDETLDYLRHLDPDTETIYYLYVVDDEGHLVGVLPLRTLVSALPDRTINDIMTPNVIAVQVDDDQERVAEIVARYDFLAVPVVDEEGRLAGIVTVDDIVDVLAEEATEDIQRLGGSEPLDMPYLATPIRSIVRKRIGWLLLLFVGATLTSNVLRFFEGFFPSTSFIALSVFVPLLIGTGGNAGSQTVTTVTRALALGEIRFREVFRVIAREASAGIGIGTILGVIALGLSILLNPQVAIVVALTMPVITVWANMMGGIIPLAADRFGIDPAVISAPFITTVVDTTGLAIYFLVARTLLTM